MAHLGSRSAAWLKVWSACWYWKECKRATPVSIRGCASAEQLVGKLTWPSCSAVWFCVADLPCITETPSARQIMPAMTVIGVRFTLPPLPGSCIRVCHCTPRARAMERERLEEKEEGATRSFCVDTADKGLSVLSARREAEKSAG